METTSSQPTMWQRSTTRRFFRWLFSWRILRRCLIAVASVVTIIVLFYSVEDWRGKRAWKAHKRQCEAKGEKFTFDQLAPPPVPDDQNLAMTPLFKPLFEYTHGPEGLAWRDTNGLARLDRLSTDLPDGRKSLERDSYGSLEKGTFVDLAAFQKFYRGNTNYPQPAVSGTAAADIRFALGKFDPEIKGLGVAASTRPYSRFSIEYDSEPSWVILLPHLARVKRICQLTELRAVAELELGQSPEAFEELKLGFRLSDSIRDEPLLIDHLVRIAMLSMNLQTVREGLLRHAWNDEQLAEFEKYLASLNLLAEYKLAMRGERAGSTSGLDWMRRQGFRGDPSNLSEGIPGAMFLMPGGWYYQNMLTISKMFQDFSLSSVDEKAHRVFPDVADKSEVVLSEMRSGPYNIFAKMLMPALSRASQKSVRMQTYVDAARVACALERYRLANGKLPESLDALTPRFMKSIPTDVIDGQPLRYQLKPNGGYVIYSIGWNQTDDDGTIGLNQSGKGVDASKGDWVWQMPGNLGSTPN